MSRPKGPGAIKFLDAKQQGDFEMRKILYCGNPEATTDETEHPGFKWQRRALELMAIHKYLDHNLDADHTASPAGSKITTHELQEQLRAEDYHVGDRELRRFMRVCGAAAKEQGKRRDLLNK